MKDLERIRGRLRLKVAYVATRSLLAILPDPANPWNDSIFSLLITQDIHQGKPLRPWLDDLLPGQSSENCTETHFKREWKNPSAVSRFSTTSYSATF
jgi:hypothetical protein